MSARAFLVAECLTGAASCVAFWASPWCVASLALVGASAVCAFACVMVNN